MAERVALTLGLFCGHMKSLRLVESFAWQMGVRPETVRGVDYRLKRSDQPANWYVAELMLADSGRRQRHWWDMADGDWGAGFFQNRACDFCDDVVAETADISFGDAWVEPYSSDGRGTNVVIVRTGQLNALLRAGIAEGRLELEKVDADFVARTQAAGLRHRREGLAFRLQCFRGPVRPRKRVEAGDKGLSARRKLIYAMRQKIGRWSHRVFWLARLVRWPGLYLGWASAALSLYHGLAYGRGWPGWLLDRLGWAGMEDRDP
ncbi:coenzyme F420-reducing hydrogenase beta subunit [Mycoplana sp. BE70]|nr:coenzyme F420-reducing hydrogenase beta subunit [Mycoplana sp. BE70]